MNKREIQKELTRSQILTAAKEEFKEKGFLNATTASIADRAGVAHGTVFLHFENKEKLVVEVFNVELKKISDELYKQLHTAYEVEDLLNRYLDYLEEEEQFHATIAREFLYYPLALKRQIFLRECGTRSYFYDVFARGIDSGKYKAVDITMAINFLFGTINYFLLNKEIFVTEGSVIGQKRN